MATPTSRLGSMSVANVALPSSVVVSLAPNSPKTLSCAFHTATVDWPWMVAPPGSELNVVSPGVALLTSSDLTVE